MVSKFIKSGLSRPLEEDDPSIFYPDSDGVPLAETDFQFYPLTETVHALRLHFTERPDVYVSGDMLLYYRMNDNTVRVAPDVFVVFGVDDHMRRSYIIWREGGKTPDFVMEIASPSTYVRDATEKRAIYAAFGVTEYWRFDPTEECFTPPLEGERLTEDGLYEAIPVHEEAASGGMLRGHSAVLSLDICVLPGLQLRLYDPINRSWLRNLAESEAALLSSEAARQSSEAALLSSEAALLSSEVAHQATEAARQSSEAAHQAAEERLRRLEAQLREQGIAPTDDN